MTTDDNTELNIPVYSVDLIEKLDKMYPPRTPTLKESEREIFEYAGRRNLIETLQQIIRDQEFQSIDPSEDILN